jgi:hypothetical protein
VVVLVVPGAPPIVLPHQEPEYINHIAVDAGGSLIKLVYLSQDEEGAAAQGPASDQSDDSDEVMRVTCTPRVDPTPAPLTPPSLYLSTCRAAVLLQGRVASPETEPDRKGR